MTVQQSESKLPIFHNLYAVRRSCPPPRSVYIHFDARICIFCRAHHRRHPLQHVHAHHHARSLREGRPLSAGVPSASTCPVMAGLPARGQPGSNPMLTAQVTTAFPQTPEALAEHPFGRIPALRHAESASPSPGTQLVWPRHFAPHSRKSSIASGLAIRPHAVGALAP